MEPKRERTTISGIITDEVKSGISKSSIPYIRFFVQVENDIYEAVGFDEVASKFNAVVKQGMLVSIRGYFRDTEAKHNKNITINTLVIGSAPASREATLIKEYGSLDSYKQDKVEFTKKMEADGFVNACEIIDGKESFKWVHSDRCMQDDNGKWWTKIDWLVSQLGAKVVFDELRKLSPTLPKAPRGQTHCTQNLTYAQQVKEKIEELIDHAKFFKEQEAPSESYDFNYEEI